MKRCVLFFALFVLAVMAAAIIGTEEQVDLIEDVSQGDPGEVNLVAHGDG
ncbi:MAG: hypothetical protein ABF293_07380 [Flavobacteriaceae bacterium]